MKFHQTAILAKALFSLIIVISMASARADVTFPTSSLSIGKSHFTVEEARTPEQMELGLMFRTALAPGAGMLFIFPQPQMAGMWMKNTLIPLDMLFINEQGEIVHIAPDTTPKSLATISADVPVKAVLELPAGTCKKQGITTKEFVRHAAFATQPVD